MSSKLTPVSAHAAWVLPDPDRALGERERSLYRSFPAHQRAMRALTYLTLEATVLGTIVDRRLIELGREDRPAPHRQPGQRPGAAGEADAVVHARLQADHALEQVLPRPHPTQRRGRDRRHHRDPPHSIVTADGTEHEVDTIILGTGFKVFDNPGMAMIRGRDGLSLLEQWQGSPRAYLGTAVAGFPNLFFIVGPNSAGGFNSIIFTSEAHINYVASCLKTMERQGVDTVEVKPEVYDAFNRDTERRLAGSVWNEGGCASWYLDANGRNGVWWPTFMARLWQRTRRFDAGSYRATPA